MQKSLAVEFQHEEHDSFITSLLLQSRRMELPGFEVLRKGSGWHCWRSCLWAEGASPVCMLIIVVWRLFRLPGDEAGLTDEIKGVVKALVCADMSDSCVVSA